MGWISFQFLVRSPEQRSDRRMRQHHIGLSLKSLVIVSPESCSLFRWSQKRSDRRDKGGSIRAVWRFIFLTEFIERSGILGNAIATQYLV